MLLSNLYVRTARKVRSHTVPIYRRGANDNGCTFSLNDLILDILLKVSQLPKSSQICKMFILFTLCERVAGQQHAFCVYFTTNVNSGG